MPCCLLLVPVCIFAVLILLTGQKILRCSTGTTGQFRWLLVLGTHVRGTTPSAMLRDRIEVTAAYLQAHPDVQCIVSGCLGRKSDITEAECLYRELVKLGIAQERILRETKAGSTMENLEFSMALLEKHTGSRPETIGILSSEFHLLRAGMCAKKQGVKAVLLPAKTRHKPTFLLYFFREILAVWYYSIFYFRRTST